MLDIEKIKELGRLAPHWVVIQSFDSRNVQAPKQSLLNVDDFVELFSNDSLMGAFSMVAGLLPSTVETVSKEGFTLPPVFLRPLEAILELAEVGLYVPISPEMLQSGMPPPGWCLPLHMEMAKFRAGPAPMHNPTRPVKRTSSSSGSANGERSSGAADASTAAALATALPCPVSMATIMDAVGNAPSWTLVRRYYQDLSKCETGVSPQELAEGLLNGSVSPFTLVVGLDLPRSRPRTWARPALFVPLAAVLVLRHQGFVYPGATRQDLALANVEGGKGTLATLRAVPSPVAPPPPPRVSPTLATARPGDTAAAAALRARSAVGVMGGAYAPYHVARRDAGPYWSKLPVQGVPVTQIMGGARPGMVPVAQPQHGGHQPYIMYVQPEQQHQLQQPATYSMQTVQQHMPVRRLTAEPSVVPSVVYHNGQAYVLSAPQQQQQHQQIMLQEQRQQQQATVDESALMASFSSFIPAGIHGMQGGMMHGNCSPLGNSSTPLGGNSTPLAPAAATPSCESVGLFSPSQSSESLYMPGGHSRQATWQEQQDLQLIVMQPMSSRPNSTELPRMGPGAVGDAGSNMAQAAHQLACGSGDSDGGPSSSRSMGMLDCGVVAHQLPSAQQQQQLAAAQAAAVSGMQDPNDISKLLHLLTLLPSAQQQQHDGSNNTKRGGSGPIQMSSQMSSDPNTVATLAMLSQGQGQQYSQQQAHVQMLLQQQAQQMQAHQQQHHMVQQIHAQQGVSMQKMMSNGMAGNGMPRYA